MKFLQSSTRSSHSNTSTRYSTLSRWAVGGALALAALSASADYIAWPSNTPVVTVDGAGQFGENVSGLFYQPAAGAQGAVLWAVQNSPSKLFKLAWNGSIYAKVTSSGWGSGKTLRYPDGSGAPDAEGITMADLATNAMYVATERSGSGSNRFSVLRYDTSGSATTLNATNEWNLTSDLPRIGSTNLGLEGIAWIPDADLVARNFVDQRTSQVYNPANYANHGTGVFFVGLEGNGIIYAYVLNHNNNSYTRIASFSSGNKAVMDLSYDRDNEVLWAWCDDTCKNKSNVFAVNPSTGAFVLERSYKKPKTLGNSNNEGIAMAPETECSGGQKAFFWADDSEASNHVIRRGSIPCGPLF